MVPRSLSSLAATTLVVAGLSIVAAPAQAALPLIGGNVTGAGGVPVSGATVTVYAESVGDWIQIGYTFTDPGGDYAFTEDDDVDRGETYRVRFSSPGRVTEYYDDAATLGAASDVEAGGDGATSVDARLATAVQLSGTTRDAHGVGVPDAAVTVYRRDAAQAVWEDVAEATTDAHGSYVVDVAPGSYRIAADGGGYGVRFHPAAATVEAAQDVVVGAGGATGADVTFAELSSVTGTVTSLTGTPLEGIEVVAKVATSGGGGREATRALTDSQGHYRLGLVPGTYYVEFVDSADHWVGESWDDDHRDRIGSAVVVDADGTGGIDAQLSPPSVISGQVTNTAGHGIGGVEVTVYEWYEDTQAWDEVAFDSTVDSGAYQVTVAAGTYRIGVDYTNADDDRFVEFYPDAASVSTATSVNVEPSGVTGIDVRLEAPETGTDECASAEQALTRARATARAAAHTVRTASAKVTVARRQLAALRHHGASPAKIARAKAKVRHARAALKQAKAARTRADAAVARAQARVAEVC